MGIEVRHLVLLLGELLELRLNEIFFPTDPSSVAVIVVIVVILLLTLVFLERLLELALPLELDALVKCALDLSLALAKPRLAALGDDVVWRAVFPLDAVLLGEAVDLLSQLPPGGDQALMAFVVEAC